MYGRKPPGRGGAGPVGAGPAAAGVQGQADGLADILPGPASRIQRSPLQRAWLFFKAYCRRPQGAIGLAIFLVFVFLAAAAPILTPYDPLRDQYLADGMARPAWMVYFPRYRNLPVTHDAFLTGEMWAMEEAEGVELHAGGPDEQTELVIEAAGGPQAEASLVYEFDYPYNAPNSFNILVPYRFSADAGVTGRLAVIFETADGRSYTMWQSNALRGQTRWATQRIDTRDLQTRIRLGFAFTDNLASQLMTEPGAYRFIVRAEMSGLDEGRRGAFYLGESRFRIPGSLHGALGSDNLGSDLWAQLLYGARISLMLGFMTALIAVIIGTLVGIVSGYLGGAVDEVLMRLVDVMLSVPVLPILIVLAALFGSGLWSIIILLALFSWMGTARLVRSLTLTLRERAFVEASRAAGGRPGWIMIRHILPNSLGLVFASAVLLIPGAIISEATLSFLGFGDPRVATWGRMLHNARSFGGFTEMAWWWILPPGFSITLLALAFVFIGNTLDDMLHRREKAS